MKNITLSNHSVLLLVQYIGEKTRREQPFLGDFLPTFAFKVSVRVQFLISLTPRPSLPVPAIAKNHEETGPFCFLPLIQSR